MTPAQAATPSILKVPAHDYKNGLAVGNWVTIQFTGALNGTDTSGVTVLWRDRPGDNASPSGAEAGIGTGAQPENEIGSGAGVGGIGQRRYSGLTRAFQKA